MKRLGVALALLAALLSVVASWSWLRGPPEPEARMGDTVGHRRQPVAVPARPPSVPIHSSPAVPPYSDAQLDTIRGYLGLHQELSKTAGGDGFAAMLVCPVSPADIAKVVVVPEDPRASAFQRITTSVNDGWARILIDQPSGAHLLNAAGHAPYRLTWSGAADGDVIYDCDEIRFEAGVAELSGRLVDASNRPLLYVDLHGCGTTATSDEDGRFVLGADRTSCSVVASFRLDRWTVESAPIALSLTEEAHVFVPVHAETDSEWRTLRVDGSVLTAENDDCVGTATIDAAETLPVALSRALQNCGMDEAGADR